MRDSKTKRMVYVAHQPVTYHSGLYKALWSKGLLDKVYFLSEEGSKELFVSDWGSQINWGDGLLEDYPYQFIRNRSFVKTRYSFLSRVNFGLFKQLIKDNPDIVLLAGYTTFSDWLVAFYCLLWKKKFVLRGEAILGAKDKNKLKLLYLKIFTSFTSKVLFSCTGNYKYWKYYVGTYKLLPLSCAVDNDFFQSNQSSKKEVLAKRNSLGIDSGSTVFIMVGKLESRKRCIDLVEAVALSKNKSTITLLFVGDGVLREEIFNRSIMLGVNSVITGFIEPKEISMYYSIADYGVSIARYDPSPKTLNEGLNFDLPYIVSGSDEIGTVSDLIKENVNGLIWTDTDSLDNLAHLLDQIIQSSSIEKGSGKSLEIINNFSFDRNCQEIKDLMKDL